MIKFRLPRLRDERGFTTVSMAVALTVSLALVFTAGQAYRINSAAAEVQEVADAAVLAAENEVAEFMIAVRVCDAAILSLSLLSVAVFGIGIVAICIPAINATIGKGLIDVGAKIVKARNSFARGAEKGLNTLQRALPFFAAANAAVVAVKNNKTGTLPASYFGVALLVPAAGEKISVGLDEDSEKMADGVESQQDTLKEAVDGAEESAREAQAAKEIGYRSDCGLGQEHSMYERARHLASLPDRLNPRPVSIDLWGFSIALERAKAYYRARLSQEAPHDNSLDERVNSALRKTVFSYAVQEMNKGFVHESQTSFEAYFPRLPKNTESLKQTRLFTQAIYPITGEGESLTMHACSFCPAATGSTSKGSLADLDAGSFHTCEQCKFTVRSVGQVLEMTSQADTGFEKHYLAVADAAEQYHAARQKSDAKSSQAKSLGSQLFGLIQTALKQVGSARIHAKPPGWRGAVACVVNTQASAADQGFASRLVGGNATLGLRAAVSAATLVEEPAKGNHSVISELLGGLMANREAEGGFSILGVADILLNCWSWLLSAYEKGIDSLINGIRQALNAIPLVSLTGLGEWAANSLKNLVKKAGLEPADQDALRPLIVNSSHVVEGDDGAFSVSYRSVQELARMASGSTTDPFTTFLQVIDEKAMDALEQAHGGLQIASIEVPIIGSIPITIAIPESVKESTGGFISQCLDAVGRAVGEIRGTKVWQ